MTVEAVPSNAGTMTERLFGSDVPEEAEPVGPSNCNEHADRAQERIACSRLFTHFLKHWRFVGEHGDIRSFATLWLGQRDAVECMERDRWLFLLKAGKLGFTELECAFDGWVALYRQPNAHVNLFSLDAKEAKGLVSIVRFGLTHLPSWLGLPIMVGEPGGDTTTQIKLRAGTDDERVITSYPATREAAIAVSAVHSHVDELAKMPWPEDTWASILSTVVPGGSVHVVSRGAGEDNYTAELFGAAQTGESPLRPFFAPWTARPRVPELCTECRHEAHPTPPCAEEDCSCAHYPSDPHRAWYEETAATMTGQQLSYFAPDSAEEALAGSGEGAFIAMELWDLCTDPTLPPLMPGDGTPVVIALDAAVTNDHFGAAIVSRHPARPDDPAVRGVRSWKPEDFPDHKIDYEEVENWLRTTLVGGCGLGHPNVHKGEPKPVEGCEACAAGNVVEPLNVVQVCYDPYQLHDMMQRIMRERLAWCDEFSQGGDRLEADSDLRMIITQRRLAHTNAPELREHVRGANYKMDSKEDTKLRIVKRSPKSKVDLLVATSMAVSRALYLNLRQRAR